jgi:hypothetical protein
LDYLAFCQQEVERRVPQLNLESESGFDWLPFGKLELQLYNIRHLQQHTGELMERLGARADIRIDWVAMKRPKQTGPDETHMNPANRPCCQGHHATQHGRQPNALPLRRG